MGLINVAIELYRTAVAGFIMVAYHIREWRSK